MRKLVSMLLIMLVAFGVVFAAEPTTSNVWLKAVIDIEEVVEPPVEDPDFVWNDGLGVKVGVGTKVLTIGDAYAEGDMADLATYGSSEKAKAVTLYSETEGTGSLDFYVAALAHVETEQTTKITMSSDGFKKADETGLAQTGEAVTDITFDYSNGGKSDYKGFGDDAEKVHMSVSASNGPDDAGLSVVGMADSLMTVKDSKVVGKITANWATGNYPSGTYLADIQVTITPDA